MANLSLLKQELEEELHSILQYWTKHAIDKQYGGFCGKIDNDNHCHTDAPKGAVLQARILWTFAAAFLQTKEPVYIQVADRAYQYITDHFVDHKYGGIYWSVDHTGKPLDTKKQIYALAFVIYGCSEYYRCTQYQPVKALAIHLYELIQRFSFDPEKGGYLEAFARDWQPVADWRLSNKDANEKKTMNTHLHVLEAYTSLYGIWPDQTLARHIAGLLRVFDEHIIDRQTGHLHLFFDEQWRLRSDTISFGHDIEASWLLLEAACAVIDEQWIQKMQANALLLVNATIPWLDEDGGLWYECEPAQKHLVKEKHWWPQAEALVGLFNAWELTGNDQYLEHVFNSWAFIKNHLLDRKNGEWFWGIDAQHAVLPNQDKAGFWKCPYHNGRACIELIKRIGILHNKDA
jgi:mannobiose 2-epimerase